MLESLATTVPGGIVRDLAGSLEARALARTVATLPGAELRRLVDLLPAEVPAGCWQECAAPRFEVAAPGDASLKSDMQVLEY